MSSTCRTWRPPMTISSMATALPTPTAPRRWRPFTAQRVDYSLARLSHYTATDAGAFPEPRAVHQLPVLRRGVRSLRPRRCWPIPTAAIPPLSGPAMSRSPTPTTPMPAPAKLPQMPTYHLKRKDGQGITLVNIGVGPSNAKTATDHIAVLRPHAWLMVGHCAGLRNSPAAGRFRAGPCLSARGSGAGRRPAGLGADPGAGRDPDRAGDARWPK